MIISNNLINITNIIIINNIINDKLYKIVQKKISIILALLVWINLNMLFSTTIINLSIIFIIKLFIIKTIIMVKIIIKLINIIMNKNSR
jgi:hypothetical protein